MDKTSTFLTVYPEAWFGRTPRAKQHAFAWDGPQGKHGEPLTEDGKRVHSATSLCGVYGSASGNAFRAEANSITCSRCVARVKAHVS